MPGARSSTTATGPSRSACSTSCATSASTSPSTRCWPRSRCAAASRASTASRSPSSATCSCRPTTSPGCTSTRAASCRSGGSDQWGNITAGIDLVRRRSGASVHGLTVPLVTRSDGEKFGKSVDGALWLDPERTSPYALYQYFMNLPDADVERYLLQLTLVPVDEARRVAAEHARAPERRAGQQRLAWEMCRADPRAGGGGRGCGGVDRVHERRGLALGRAARGAQRRDPDDALRRRRPRRRRPAGREQARGQQGRGAPPDRGRRHLRQRRRARRGPAAGRRTICCTAAT